MLIKTYFDKETMREFYLALQTGEAIDPQGRWTGSAVLMLAGACQLCLLNFEPDQWFLGKPPEPIDVEKLRLELEKAVVVATQMTADAMFPGLPVKVPAPSSPSGTRQGA